MASSNYRNVTAPVPVERLDHWLIAIRAAINIIMDAYPDIHEPLQPAEQLVVTTIHQLCLTENAILQVLGQEMVYVPSRLVDPVQ